MGLKSSRCGGAARGLPLSSKPLRTAANHDAVLARPDGVLQFSFSGSARLMSTPSILIARDSRIELAIRRLGLVLAWNYQMLTTK